MARGLGLADMLAVIVMGMKNAIQKGITTAMLTLGRPRISG